MDGVAEPGSPTPPTDHQHQSGHLTCYEGRTSSRALDRAIGSSATLALFDQRQNGSNRVFEVCDPADHSEAGQSQLGKAGPQISTGPE
jgi:hypothetical protein